MIGFDGEMTGPNRTEGEKALRKIEKGTATITYPDDSYENKYQEEIDTIDKELVEGEKFRLAMIASKRVKTDFQWFLERLKDGMTYQDYHDANKNGPRDLTKDEFDAIRWCLTTHFDEEKTITVETEKQASARQFDED